MNYEDEMDDEIQKKLNWIKTLDRRSDNSINRHSNFSYNSDMCVPEENPFESVSSRIKTYDIENKKAL